jgi:uncharacterized protein YjiS (DUF1127 family)
METEMNDGTFPRAIGVFAPAGGLDPRAVVAPWRRVSLWLSRRRERIALAGLIADDRLLSDIGLSRAEALREADKPFWVR